VKLIAYLRVSTDKQAEDGYGLDVQRADCIAYARAHHHKIVRWLTDEGVSGSNGLDSRVALPDALAALKAGDGDGLLIPKLDRLSRDMLLQEQLLREVWIMGREVLSCLGSEQNLRDDPEDPGREMLRQILGAVHQYERKMIVLRLRKGRAAKAAKGGFAYGSPPYGWRAHDGELERDEAEQQVVARMLGMRSAGASYAHIATSLNDDGIASRHGRWHAQTVSRALARAEVASA
jgi:DNA invertase Pin-like site-specific DNA recombinase